MIVGVKSISDFFFTSQISKKHSLDIKPIIVMFLLNKIFQMDCHIKIVSVFQYNYRLKQYYQIEQDPHYLCIM